jgi:hypothetical protein
MHLCIPDAIMREEICDITFGAGHKDKRKQRGFAPRKPLSSFHIQASQRQIKI